MPASPDRARPAASPSTDLGSVKSAAACASLALMPLVLAGCALETRASELPAESSAGRAPIEMPDDTMGIVQFVFDLRPYSPGVDRILYETEQAQTASCMAAAGFEYRPIPYTDNSQATHRDAMALFPPLPNDDDVQRHGYRAFLSPVEAEPAGVAQAMRADEAARHDVPGYEHQLVGDGGCGIEVVSFLENELRLQAPDLYQALIPGFQNALAAGGSIDLSAWQSCMSEAGYEASHLEDGYRDFAVDPFSESPPSRSEIDHAQRDLECRRLTGVREAALSGVAEALQAFVDQQALAIHHLQEVTDAEERRIVDLYGEHPVSDVDAT